MRKTVALTALTWTAILVTPALGAQAAPALTTVARFSFDTAPNGAGVVIEETGSGHNVATLSRNGGGVRSVPHGTGGALAFPDRCGGSRCARAIMQGSDDPRLDTGTADMAFGASVLLRPDQVTNGQNVVQKGVSRSRSQWKLQVDGSAGRPSCVLVGSGSKRHYIAYSAVGVADGNWHSITCQRSGGQLTISVDGVAQGSAAVPAGVVLDNDAPLRIGGKNVAADNDQFVGTIDDVWVAR